MNAVEHASATGVSRWRLVFGLLLSAALVAGAGYWLRSLEWPIEVVRIDGETRFSDREALQKVVTTHVQAGFFGTDLPALRADLKAMPWVRDASLRRVWPDRLDVDIREHEPAAVWNGDALVSTRGAVFAPETFDFENLPRLRGPEGQAANMLARRHRFDLLLMPAGMRVAGLELDERRSWSAELDDGLRVRLGREEIDARLERLVAAWPAIMAGQSERIRRVDLRYPNGFAIAWHEGTSDSPEGGA